MTIIFPPEYPQDPNAVSDYMVDLTSWLGSGESVIAATVVAEAGLTVDSVDFSATDVIGWLSGGTVETRYAVTFHWETNQGRVDERSIVIYVKNR